MAQCKYDWIKIRREYIAGKSAQTLSEKYGCSRKMISNKAAAEGWTKERDSRVDAAYQAARQERLATEAADHLAIREAARRELREIDKLIADHGSNAQYAKMITGALKDIKEILGLKCDLDLEEQRARIANLRKMAQEDKEVTITVVMGAGIDDYCD